MKKFFINTVLQFILRPKFKTTNDDDCAFIFSRDSIGGLWYYLKMVPCDRWGLFPVAGIFTEKEISEFDKKAYEKNMKLAIELSKKLGTIPASELNSQSNSYEDIILRSVKIDKNNLN